MKKIIRKNEIENLLNSFAWDYREIFFENSIKSNIRLLNWVIESSVINEENGFSMLSRTWNLKYFKACSNLSNIKNEVESFYKTYNLSSKDSKKVKLSWKDEFKLDSKNLKKDLKKFSAFLELSKGIIDKENIIVSYNVNFLLTSKNFIVGNTLGSFTEDKQYYNTLYIALKWKKWENIEEVMEKITWTDICKNINKSTFLKTLKKAISKLKQTLDWTNSPSGLMDVIIWNEAWGTIIHEAIWHWLEADLQNSSVYRWKIWQKVAASDINVVDDPTLPNKRWAYSYDHEWTKTQKTYLIKDWILVSYLHNNSTAELFNTKSTWHWRRESYKYTTLVRMWTTHLEPGLDKKEDLIKKVKEWIYISSMGWWQVNTITWDFVFQVSFWYKIKDWKLREVIKWWMISWNWPEMLNNIFWICNDLEYFDWWTCWKWQQMPVSDGTPTILVKLKVTGKN